jgi:hypothetical protein
VFELRDLQHWTAAEVGEVLGLSEGNQRVLLHRARVCAVPSRSTSMRVNRPLRGAMMKAFALVGLHPWLTCLECVESVTEFLEGASPQYRDRVLAHLKICPDCPQLLPPDRTHDSAGPRGPHGLESRSEPAPRSSTSSGDSHRPPDEEI